MWSEDEETWQTRVDVGDIPRLKTELTGLFPGCTLDVKRSENVVIVAGLLSSAEQVNELRDFLDATGLRYLDRTRLAGVQQVEIEVRVAEASRRALRELGINTTIRATTEHGLGRLWPPVGNDFATGTVGPKTGLASLIAGFPHADLEVFLEALAENHYVQVLAEPNLTAASGEEANFLAGGEFPIPVVQGGAGGTSTAISIEYKEYGVALQFVPIVLGNNSIRLHVGTEVSRLSLKGAVVIEGFRVPAVETRRAETTLELRSGQMFGMAGLIEQDTEALNSRVPWLGDLPVLGPLFRSVQYERGETELVVLVRASLVEPLSTDSSPPLPGALHVPPTDAQLYGEGRLEGTPPTDVQLPDAAWRRELGLEWLRSPGTWARYDSPSIPSRSTLQLPATTPPSPQDTEARTVASAPAASASSD
jgi:pilus assembly protein CpaC